MAAAQEVRVVRAPNYAWIDVLDNEGAVWRYHRREWVGPAAGYFDLHFPFGEPRLMIQGDGTARLRQQGPGLPRQMIVHRAVRSCSSFSRSSARRTTIVAGSWWCWMRVSAVRARVVSRSWRRRW